MPFVKICSVLTCQEVAQRCFRLAFEAPEIAREASPGQFCMIQIAEGLSPFLRRPMSFERLFANGFSILFKVEGEGTRMMAQYRAEQEVSVQGPLGRGFPVERGPQRHLIVAGGIGVAPFPALAEELTRVCGKAPEVVLAARSQDLLLCKEEFDQMGCAVHLATDDGSAGEKATAVELLERLSPGPGTRVYACGPMPMLCATARVTHAHDVESYVSLEAQMACGDGACLGCVVESTREGNADGMVRVCREGPVFDAREIKWSVHQHE
ncbi:MAG TPA: dihydroorotate dehydrogenase electron transfer subunit [Candidatus Hydrogenedentes bacterium]|nr:dihydroorotate dehydrogenase electron transfer subunit [Candidatus Hydrogenedentota bacterium]